MATVLDTLKECIVEMCSELLEVKRGDVTLPSGETVRFGSLAHLKDLEKSIADLERYRDSQRRGSDARATYARALSRLRAMHKLAMFENEKQRAI